MSETKIPKMRVKLGESNELKFMLSIKGSTSDPGATQPKIRFLVTEVKTGISYIFPMEKLEEGMVGVNIPAMPHLFQEGVEYTGNVEVIMGSRWFNPATIGLVFEQEMKVEAAPLLTEKVTENLIIEEEDEYSSVIKPALKIQDQKRVSSLNDDTILNVLFTEKSSKQPIKLTPSLNKEPVKPASPLKKPVINPEIKKMKASLKSMISESWNELEE